ncbi:MAG TPA: DUF3093 domain-containing protein [Streptosporangiaceae bacterium]|jgi:hypothetical protein
MRDYHERLRVPISWWLISAMCVLILGTELFAGFPLWAGVVTYIVLALICTATLLHWGGAVISVAAGELRAGSSRPPQISSGRTYRRGSARLPLASAGEVRPLDQAQTRAMRGPRSDPRAYLLIRPYLRESVYVEVTDADAEWPYLLMCTRHPGSLAEAIERSRAALVRQD